ncbi:MAG: enoyl-CoA hydratase/isomerase family protein [Usitatibacter sp.]
MEERLAGGEILAAVRGKVATLVLNRPGAHNALSMEMLHGIGERLDAWERDGGVRTIVMRGAGDKAFCAGGDIRALRASIEAGTPMHRDFMRAEYALDHRIHTYPKPIVAHMDGIVMGGGMGIGQGAALRVVGDRTRMAMPETVIGLFPDVGASFWLSRLPGELGAYLGLLGPTLGAADAIYCGLADLNVGAAGPSELEGLHGAIDRHFAHPTMEEIAASLATEDRVEFRPWAEATLAGLAQRSPTLLKVTLEQLRRGRNMTLADCFRMELGLVNACFDQGDVREGIRARIVDKDNWPRWNPARLEDVDPAAVDAFFAPRWNPGQHPLASLS